MLDYSTLKEDLQGGMQRYVEHRISPGSFLRAVLANDLKGALGQADIYNRVALFEIVSWCYNELPTNLWGSEENVHKHLVGEAEANG